MGAMGAAQPGTCSVAPCSVLARASLRRAQFWHVRHAAVPGHRLPRLVASDVVPDRRSFGWSVGVKRQLGQIGAWGYRNDMVSTALCEIVVQP